MSSNPIIAAVPGAPAIVIDGDPAARLADDVRIVQGRLPQPSAAVLEVVLTAKVARDYHLTVGDALPLTTDPLPTVRVVGIVAPVGAAFPVERAILTVYEDDPIRYYAQSNPVDAALTSNEAIEAYPYDWSRLPLARLVGNGCSRPKHFIGSACFVTTPWLVKWIAQSQTAQMSAREINDLFYRAQPDYPALINTLLLDADPAAVARAGLDPRDTGWQAIRGDEIGDFRDGVIFDLIVGWLALVVVVWLILRALARVVRALARRRTTGTASGDHTASRTGVVRAFLAWLALMALAALAVGGAIVRPVALLVARIVFPPHLPAAGDALSGVPASYTLLGGVSAGVVLVVAFAALWLAFARVRAGG